MEIIMRINIIAIKKIISRLMLIAENIRGTNYTEAIRVAAIITITTGRNI